MTTINKNTLCKLASSKILEDKLKLDEKDKKYMILKEDIKKRDLPLFLNNLKNKLSNLDLKKRVLKEAKNGKYSTILYDTKDSFYNFGFFEKFKISGYLHHLTLENTFSIIDEFKKNNSHILVDILVE